MTQRFVPPPNWPRPPEGWVPPKDWQPDPAWGPAPEGWQFWTEEPPPAAAPVPVDPWAAPAAALPSVAKTIVITVLFGLFGLIPAYLDAEKAKRAGQPGGRYWVAFGASLAGSVALWVVTVVALVATLVHTAGVSAAGGGAVVEDPSSAGAGDSISTSPPGGDGSNGTCAFTPDSSGTTARNVGTPPSTVATSGTTQLTMTTNFGPISITLDHAQAPCATASFQYLAGKRFFDNTPCHRETDSPGLKVLQCGDPSGTGTGGAGYEYKTHTTGRETYQRGVVAMANSGQGYDGSQFFLVWGDSELSPDYTVVGAVDDAGLTVLDAIAAHGNDGSNGAGDGAPSQPVTIESVRVAR